MCICHVLGPGSLNFERRKLVTAAEDWCLEAGMWCLVDIEKSPGFLALSFICDSGVSSG